MAMLADVAYLWGKNMRRFQSAVLAAVAIVGFASVASAADMPVKARPMPMVAPVATWTGCYIGANVGYGWANKNWQDPQVANFDAGSSTATGGLGGGQIGCDYQTGQFVFGVQGMFDWASLTGNNLYTGTTTETLSSKVSSVATLTGRVGYAVQPITLLYIKGGAAWVRDTFTDADPTAPYSGDAKSTRSGWTLGAGLEYQFAPNWSVFGEYNYMDFGRSTSTLNFNPGTYDYDIRQNVQALQLGINYRFSTR
jgi:outer membrane immunogenic protein